MDRVFNEPLLGTQEGPVHVSLLLGVGGTADVVMACRLDATARCIVSDCRGQKNKGNASDWALADYKIECDSAEAVAVRMGLYAGSGGDTTLWSREARMT